MDFSAFHLRLTPPTQVTGAPTVRSIPAFFRVQK